MFKNIITRLKKILKSLGPGFITGAADDDPSGVATYSIAGAQFGYLLNWLCIFLTPMMVAVQEMCGRIGMCSGMGLAGVIKKYYSKKLLYSTVILLAIANLINIGADLGIMASCVNILIGGPYLIWLAIIALFSILLELLAPYKKYSYFLRIMGLTLLVYVFTGFITKQNWPKILNETLIPHVNFSAAYLMTMIGFIGTTISPYLFFWQADEEVEEEIEKGEIKDFEKKPKFKYKDIKFMRRDTITGMIFSNVISFFIVITTAATLHNAGIFNIESPGQAALALRPIAGDFAFLLFTIGIVGIGLQSVPILSGGIAYAIAEVFGFSEGLNKKLVQARAFYCVLGLAILIGALFNLIGINPIKALYYAAVINGLISIPLIAVIIKLSDDKRVVGEYQTGKLSKAIAIVTLLFVGGSSLMMLGSGLFS